MILAQNELQPQEEVGQWRRPQDCIPETSASQSMLCEGPIKSMGSRVACDSAVAKHERTHLSQLGPC